MLIIVNGKNFSSWAQATRAHGAEYGMNAQAAQRWLVNKGLKVEVNGSIVEVVGSKAPKKVAKVYIIELVRDEYLKSQAEEVKKLESELESLQAELSILSKYNAPTPKSLGDAIATTKKALESAKKVDNAELVLFFGRIVQAHAEEEKKAKEEEEKKAKAEAKAKEEEEKKAKKEEEKKAKKEEEKKA